MRKPLLGWIALLLLPTSQAMADVRLPSIFADNLVLQRDGPVRVWGTADAGEAVAVSLGEQTAKTTADEHGRWTLTLPASPTTDQPRDLTVTGKNKLLVKNVLVGDVWICAGQSNMQFGLGKSLGGEAAVADSINRPTLRLFNVADKIVEGGAADVDGAWSPASPKSSEAFSGVGYFFGRTLQDRLHVPIGLIEIAWGATEIETWMPSTVIGPEPKYKLDGRAKLQAQYDAQLASGKKPLLPHALMPKSRYAACYESMVKPLAGLSVRGVIWYQGEQNIGAGPKYADLLTRMITGWRTAWGAPLPFGVVQLPNHHAPATQPGESEWAEIREAQRTAVQAVGHAGLVATIDLGDAQNLHPTNKHEVGDRLASWALASVYGQTSNWTGPRLAAATRTAGSITLTFTDVGSGLKTQSPGAPAGFTVPAGAGWRIAEAQIVAPDRIVIHDAAAAKIRYAWADNPIDANLTNDTGLPAVPFEVTVNPSATQP